MTVNRETFCTYEEGMFADELSTLADTTEVLAAYHSERGALMHHEAAHAVFNYAVGFGASSISLRRTVDESGCAGKVELRRTPRLMVFKRGYSRLMLANGVAVVAGPAAERKFCILAGAPIRTRGASESDHSQIDQTDAGLAHHAGRRDYAYRRLVWHKAQAALENPVIWGAVERLATELWSYYPDEVEESGEHTETMDAAKARKIIRSAGVKRGILGFIA